MPDFCTCKTGLPVLFGTDFLLQLPLLPLKFRQTLLLCQQFIVATVSHGSFFLQGFQPIISFFKHHTTALVGAKTNNCNVTYLLQNSQTHHLSFKFQNTKKKEAILLKTPVKNTIYPTFKFCSSIRFSSASTVKERYWEGCTAELLVLILLEYMDLLTVYLSSVVYNTFRYGSSITWEIQGSARLRVKNCKLSETVR